MVGVIINMNGYGKKIRFYRKRLKLTQEELGDKLGVTKSFISKIESESTAPNLEMLNSIAEALEVDIVDFFDNKIEAPDDLKAAGGRWIVLGEDLEKQGITPEQVRQWAEIATKYSQNKD